MTAAKNNPGRSKKKPAKSTAAGAVAARKRSFIEALRQIGNVTMVCVRLDMSRSQAYDWRAKDAEFRLLWDDAIEHAADLLEAEAWRRGVQGVERPVYQGGQQVGTVREFSDTLLIFLLKGIRPHKFRDRVEVVLKDPLVAIAEATGMPEQEVITAVREISEQKLLSEKAAN